MEDTEKGHLSCSFSCWAMAFQSWRTFEQKINEKYMQFQHVPIEMSSFLASLKKATVSHRFIDK